MKLDIYQIDAFSEQPFKGNPAAVCPLTDWLPKEIMQSIAEENNLSETAFLVPDGNGFHIRWFTPTEEVDLCGHATLGAAHVIFEYLGFEQDCIQFQSKSGILTVQKNDGWLMMNFPSQVPQPCQTPDEIRQAFESKPIETLRSEDYLVVFDREEDVLTAQPKLDVLSKLALRGVVITAKSETYDFVSRFFGPKFGINEDPVTGSSHTQLIPYWSKIMGKNRLRAKQVSSRGGELLCELVGDRVHISGKAVTYLKGQIEITKPL